jgi:hypothetical protein
VLLGIAALFALVAMTSVASAAENMVWLEPESSSAEYCSTTEVEVWADITNISGCAGGTINLSYDPGCADVTDWANNSAAWRNGTWDTRFDGREWITFANLTPHTGEVLIGTLTIHCNSTDRCTTPLTFNESSSLRTPPPSVPMDVEWKGGTFSCVGVGTCGDVNCDEEVDIGDVTLILNHWGNPDKYPLCDEWAGDVNCDGAIDIGDVTLVLNHWGNPEKYPLSCC